MKILKKSLVFVYILISICCAGIVLADEPDNYTKKVQAIASFLNSRVKENVGKGEFEVITNKKNEKSTVYIIKYKLPGGKTFQYEYDFRPSHPRLKIELELSSHRFGGFSSLLFNYVVWGDAGMYKVPYIIFPQDMRFASLDFSAEAPKKTHLEVKDLDQDNDLELIDLEEESWAWECAHWEGGEPGVWWPRVFHLDPKSGKLLDVSQRFTQYYKEFMEQYFSSEVQQNIKNSTLPSPDCKAKYIEYLDRLKKASGEVKTQSTVETKDIQVDDSITEMLAKEFEFQYRNQHIDKLINLLGEPSRTEAVPYEQRYIWNFEDINKMPVRIIIMRKNEADCYCDEFIANINPAKGITSLWCKSNKQWLTKEELRKKQSIVQKSPGEKIDFSGTWSGYRIISGQKRFFNLVLKQNNNKIAGISTDTLAFSDGNKAVQGTVSGDISDMRIQFTRKWIDHPKGMTGETDFSGTMDRETGTVTGTYKINNDTGDWVMERKTIDAGLSQPKTSLSPNVPATEGNVYEGTWVGSYSCRQGITGLQLQLKAFSQEQLAGVFSFFPVSSNPNVPYGSFNVNAMVRRDGKLVVRAGNWIQRPRGFSTVNLEGQISSDSQSISGRVLTYGCSGFQVQRKID